MHDLHIGERKKLFFMHIPKTAGMSLRLYLSNQYLTEDICPFADWQQIVGREQSLPFYRLVQGHFTYNFSRLLSNNVQMLVMLRDPLRRALSSFNHLRRDPNFHADHHLAKSLTLSEIIRHPRLMMMNDNIQTRYLSASSDPRKVSAYLQSELLRYPAAAASDLEGPPDIRLAIERLQSIEFVGLTENIGALVSSMAQEMSYHPPLHFPVVNQDPTGIDSLHSISEEEREILREHNELDLQLYDFAKTLLERRVFLHGMAELVRKGTYSVPLGSFEVPLSGIMPGSGWYTPERDGNSFWRWTGPSDAFTLEIPLRYDRSYRFLMTFTCKRPLDPNDFTATANYDPVAINLTSLDHIYRCEFIIPETALNKVSGFCRLQFKVRQENDDDSQDIRKLGVCVRRVAFDCLHNMGQFSAET